MEYLPLFASLKNRDCLVVGGGQVGERRVEQLLAAEASPTVLSPRLTPRLAILAAEGRIKHLDTGFDGHSLMPYWLIVAATDDPEMNACVSAAAEEAKVFCNVVDNPALCTFIMPTIIDRDPVTIAISSAGNSPVVARRVKSLIEEFLPRRIGKLAALAGRWRERVRAAIPDLDQRRHFWQYTLVGEVAEHVYAGRDSDSERALDAALQRWHSSDAESEALGEAYLVGAGPGDPELITLRGRRLLANADAVLYDRLVNPKILQYARRDAELISVGKKAGEPSIKQSQINRLLVQLVRSGKKVCRLKGGDPMIFGRVGEELNALTAAKLPFQIVPGVSALEGCAAYAGIPLTLRGQSQAILIATGHTQDHIAADLSGYRSGQTLALYMAVAHFQYIADRLRADGHSVELPVAIIENGTTDTQRVILTSLAMLAATAAENDVRSPALLLVGETVRCASRYAWFNQSLLDFTDDSNGLARVS